MLERMHDVIMDVYRCDSMRMRMPSLVYRLRSGQKLANVQFILISCKLCGLSMRIFIYSKSIHADAGIHILFMQSSSE